MVFLEKMFLINLRVIWLHNERKIDVGVNYAFVVVAKLPAFSVIRDSRYSYKINSK